MRKPWLCACEQSRVDDDRRSVRPLPESGHRDPRGDVWGVGLATSTIISDVGLAGVIQLTPEGEIYPTIRYFPNALRALGQALGSERLPFRTKMLCERDLDIENYVEVVECDWTSGSFMLARREALESAGFLDERFFIYSEEPDLCLRMKQAGWRVCHVPEMTIVHYAGKGGVRPKMWAQDAYTRMQHARKHFSPIHRGAYAAALALGYAARASAPVRDPSRDGRREAARAALRVLIGLEGPPFGEPPKQAIPSDRPIT